MPDNRHDAIIVALGSNQAQGFISSIDLLEKALLALEAKGLKVVARSSWWRSAAWPDPNDPPFINGVAIIETLLSAPRALATLHAIETEFGRSRHLANAPRTLDLDLIAYGRMVCSAPALPHPRAHDRRFVMGPLAEIAPDWRHPTSGRTAARLAEDATIGLDAAPADP